MRYYHLIEQQRSPETPFRILVLVDDANQQDEVNVLFDKYYPSEKRVLRDIKRAASTYGAILKNHTKQFPDSMLRGIISIHNGETSEDMDDFKFFQDDISTYYKFTGDEPIEIQIEFEDLEREHPLYFEIHVSHYKQLPLSTLKYIQDVFRPFSGKKASAYALGERHLSDYMSDITKHLNEERIVQAAFWDKKRKKAIPSGPIHNLAVLPTDDRRRFIDGYITDAGRFLSRIEAAKLVKKHERFPDDDYLWSEDLKGLGFPADRPGRPTDDDQKYDPEF